MDNPENLFVKHGFDFPESKLAEDSDQAASIAAEIGFPVVLKIASPDIIHKTDVGGVELNLTSEKEVRDSFDQILTQVEKTKPQAKILGVQVEEMCEKGVEIILGLNQDPQFGPTVLFGLGGIFTEILSEVSMRVLPIEEEDAREMINEVGGQQLLDGYRGQKPVSREMLTNLILKAGNIGEELWGRLDSVDLNPIAVWEDNHRVLDTEISLREKEANFLQEENPNTDHLDLFFEPESVALVGASGTPGKIGNAILDSLANHDYDGDVYPVNPKQEKLMGLQAYDSVRDLPQPVDLVVVAIGLPLVPDIVRDCAEMGIHNMVIVSGGGKELGGKSEELEEKIAALAEEHDIRIIGPNCIGVFSGDNRLDTFFQPHERMERPSDGKVSLITQSGTVGCSLLEKFSQTGVGKFVSYGNRLDVDEADLISYLADDPNTDIISSYIEGLGDGRKFLAQAKNVSDNIPIIVFKAGRSPQAADAAASHTGFFGGTYEVYRGAFHQAGLIAVDSFEEFHATVKAHAMQPEASGNRVAIISNGAGVMVQAIDLLDQYDLNLPNLADSTLRHLRDVFPDHFIIQNPLDLTGSATSSDYETGITAAFQDNNVDIVMPWFVFQDAPLEEEIVDILARLSDEYDKPILCGAMGGAYTESISESIESNGIPVFHSVGEWQAAARGLSFTK